MRVLASISALVLLIASLLSAPLRVTPRDGKPYASRKEYDDEAGNVLREINRESEWRS
jgi:hypothetical protein